MGSPVIKRGEVIPLETRQLIARRYKTVTAAINRDFWGIYSDTANSFYVGSYGRNTAIDSSDIDILVCLPKGEYERYDYTRGNGQSRLLQAVRNAILTSYPRSDVRADGQVVKIQFTDGMKFEILPAFQSKDWYGIWDGKYVYPDTNMGGNWRSTNPKAEQDAMAAKNATSKGLLNDTCKHIRYIRDNYFSSYKLSGIVIDSFVYKTIGSWSWCEPGQTSSSAPGDFERHLLSHFNLLCYGGNLLLTAPGSGQSVDSAASVECLKKVLTYMAN